MSGKRIILTTFGSYGDVHPYMALAMELQNRGHHPVIATSELYREKMETAGFDFLPVRPNLPPPAEQDPELIERIMNPKKGSGVLLNEMLFPFLREAYEDLLKAVAGADLLLTHPITFAWAAGSSEKPVYPGFQACLLRSHFFPLSMTHLCPRFGSGCDMFKCSARRSSQAFLIK